MLFKSFSSILVALTITINGFFGSYPEIDTSFETPQAAFSYYLGELSEVNMSTPSGKYVRLVKVLFDLYNDYGSSISSSDKSQFQALMTFNSQGSITQPLDDLLNEVLRQSGIIRNFSTSIFSWLTSFSNSFNDSVFDALNFIFSNIEFQGANIVFEPDLLNTVNNHISENILYKMGYVLTFNNYDIREFAYTKNPTFYLTCANAYLDLLDNYEGRFCTLWGLPQNLTWEYNGQSYTYSSGDFLFLFDIRTMNDVSLVGVPRSLSYSFGNVGFFASSYNSQWVSTPSFNDEHLYYIVYTSSDLQTSFFGVGENVSYTRHNGNFSSGRNGDSILIQSIDKNMSFDSWYYGYYDYSGFSPYTVCPLYISRNVVRYPYFETLEDFKSYTLNTGNFYRSSVVYDNSVTVNETNIYNYDYSTYNNQQYTTINNYIAQNSPSIDVLQNYLNNLIEEVKTITEDIGEDVEDVSGWLEKIFKKVDKILDAVRLGNLISFTDMVFGDTFDESDTKSLLGNLDSFDFGALSSDFSDWNDSAYNPQTQTVTDEMTGTTNTFNIYQGTSGSGFVPFVNDMYNILPKELRFCIYCSLGFGLLAVILSTVGRIKGGK